MENDDVSTIVKRIRERRKTLDLSYQELANKTSMSKSTLQRYETGAIKNIPLDKLEILAKALEVTPAFLMGWEDRKSASDVINYKKYNLKSVHKVKIPLLGKVAAGQPILADEQYGEYLICDDEIKADFALIVKGTSMEPTLYEGNVVFVRSQPTVDNGQIAVVLIEDEATLKHYYKIGNTVTLTGDNPAFPPLVYSGADLENIKIVGLALSYQRYLK